MTIKIRIGSKPSELKGISEELLVVGGQIIARFFDGQLVNQIPNLGETTFVPKEVS